VLTAHDAQAHEPETRAFDHGFKDRFQMRRLGKNGDTPNTKPFPRGGLATATQQVLLLGMRAM
jgi:hypothetical protein